MLVPRTGRDLCFLRSPRATMRASGKASCMCSFVRESTRVEGLQLSRLLKSSTNAVMLRRDQVVAFSGQGMQAKHIATTSRLIGNRRVKHIWSPRRTPTSLRHEATQGDVRAAGAA
jgi:hypothetical protein